nr:RNA polymerase RPB1 large subunit [Marseillevirus cajuinensis]
MKIRAVQFSVSSPEEILSYSCCEITKAETKLEKPDKESKAKGALGNPQDGSLYDERLGTLDRLRACKTCGQNNIHCPGHFGHIVLKKPIIHPYHSKILKDILECMCLSCSRLLVTEEASETLGFLRYRGIKRLKALNEYCGSVSACPNCGQQTPHFFLEGNHVEACYADEGAKKGKPDKSKSTRIPAESLITKLKKLSNEDCVLLGLNNFLIDDPLYKNKELFPVDMGHRHATRPEWFILTVLPVLPPVDRPPVIIKGKQREDDITDAYVSIVKANIALTKHLNGTTKKRLKETTKVAKVKKDPYDDLCEKVRILFDNKENKKTVNGQVPHGFRQVLTGKDGRFRNTVLGKRADHNARSVITPDPTLPVDVLGVPRFMEDILTVRKMVCDSTRRECEEIIASGKCKTLIRGGRPLDVEMIKAKMGECKIVDKDVLIVPLTEGYPVMFNRQPTLRIEGIMGLKVRFHNGKTFKFNPSLCTPYGGDSHIVGHNRWLPPKL